MKTKKGPTLVKEIEKKFNLKLGVSGNMKLSTYLRRKGFVSLSKLIDNK